MLTDIEAISGVTEKVAIRTCWCNETSSAQAETEGAFIHLTIIKYFYLNNIKIRSFWSVFITKIATNIMSEILNAKATQYIKFKIEKCIDIIICFTSPLNVYNYTYKLYEIKY